MKFSISGCRTILDTLPIGYYCKRRVAVELSETADTSYYSPMDDKIVISYPIIARGLEALPDTANVETAVRSMLYHETSHAILTPAKLMEMTYNEEYRTAINIFEDERIETLLANFYQQVDFKAQLYAINGEPTEPSNNLQKFFNIVRYRSGDARHVTKVSKLINRYKNLNRASDYYKTGSYFNDIYDFYREIKREEEKDKKTDTENTSVSFIQSDEEINGPLSLEEITELMEDATQNPFGLVGNKAREAENFAKSLNLLFANFNKKNSGGNGFNTYSGIFNPRAVTRKDYKYFERATPINGNNKFGTLHLNLFLDKSGSFSNNEDLTNSIIKTLTDLEKKNHNFTMDVYFINDKFVHANTIKERVMKCSGGNTLPNDIEQIITKAQKPNTFNYNIFLFDGDAFTDSPDPMNIRRKLFKAIDKKQTFLISDCENKPYIDNFTSAKVIITNRYTNELITNISRAFQIMLG